MSILKQYTIDAGYIDNEKATNYIFILFFVFYYKRKSDKKLQLQKKYESLDAVINNAGGLGGRSSFENMETSF